LLDLAEAAELVGSRLVADRYVVNIELATELPSIWFDRLTRTHAEGCLERSRGTAAVHGRLRRAVGDSWSQLFTIWIVEMPSPDGCQQLVADVGSGIGDASRHVAGVAAGRLFALVVAGSCRIGAAPVETRASVAEFAERTRVLLAAWAARAPASNA
jgi:hypothetical protein